MPRPRIHVEDEEAIETIWRSDKKLSARKILEQFITDHGEEGEPPSERWIREHLRPLRIKERNSREERPIKPWEEWDKDPGKIRTSFAVHRVAINVCKKYAIDDFVGLTARQSNWVDKLRPFFDLADYDETAWLLDFATCFADDEKFSIDMGRKFTPRIAATNLLEKWQWKSDDWPQANESLTPPAPWEIGDDVEQRIAITLGYKPPIYKPSTEPRVERGQSSVPSPNKSLEELRSQGFPIDESHAGLGMVYTNPPKQEESELVEEELLDGAYRVISMATTDQMIMSAETPATGDTQAELTQDAVLKLVSELLQDPGTLSKERAAELGVDLVATFDEILNRHEDKEE
jgi:hypothetical protein